MADESDRSDYLLAKQMDYRPRTYDHSQYQYSKIYPQQGTANQAIPVNSTLEVYLEIPTRVWCPARSYLEGTIVAPAGANVNGAPGFTYFYDVGMPWISQCQLLSRSGMYLADCQYFQNMMEVYSWTETPMSEYLTSDSRDPIHPSNISSSGNQGANVGQPNTRPTRIQSNPEGVVVGVNGGALVNQDIADSVLEPRHTIASNAAANAAVPEKRFKLSLGRIYNTIFSMDKDFYFPEILLLRLVFGPGSRAAFLCSDGNSPPVAFAANAANVAIFTENAAGNAGFSLQGLTLNLAIEQNPVVVDQLTRLVHSGSFSCIIPWSNCFKFNPGASTSQSVQYRLTRGMGRVVKKIVHVPFNNVESSVTSFDHNNYGSFNPAVAQANNIQTYSTYMDNVKLQQADISTSQANLDDWRTMRNLIKGTPLGLSSQTYQYKWAHIDQFDGLGSPIDLLPHAEPKENVESGLSLSVDRLWLFQATTANSAFNHYTFVVTTKLLTIDSTGVLNTV